MKALVGAFNQEKALVGAFSVIVQPVVEPMEQYTALLPGGELWPLEDDPVPEWVQEDWPQPGVWPLPAWLWPGQVLHLTLQC